METSNDKRWYKRYGTNTVARYKRNVDGQLVVLTINIFNKFRVILITLEPPGRVSNITKEFNLIARKRVLKCYIDHDDCCWFKTGEILNDQKLIRISGWPRLLLRGRRSKVSIVGGRYARTNRCGFGIIRRSPVHRACTDPYIAIRENLASS